MACGYVSYEKYSLRSFWQSYLSFFHPPSFLSYFPFISFRLFFFLTCLRASRTNLFFFSTCLSVLLAWRSVCMRRVINEFVRVSFTVPLRPTHEPSIVEETDDFFLLLRSYRSSSTFFCTGFPIPLSVHTAFCNLLLVQFNGCDYTYCSNFFSVETNIQHSVNVSVTYFQIQWCLLIRTYKKNNMNLGSKSQYSVDIF